MSTRPWRTETFQARDGRFYVHVMGGNGEVIARSTKAWDSEQAAETHMSWMARSSGLSAGVAVSTRAGVPTQTYVYVDWADVRQFTTENFESTEHALDVRDRLYELFNRPRWRQILPGP